MDIICIVGYWIALNNCNKLAKLQYQLYIMIDLKFVSPLKSMLEFHKQHNSIKKVEYIRRQTGYGVFILRRFRIRASLKHIRSWALRWAWAQNSQWYVGSGYWTLSRHQIYLQLDLRISISWTISIKFCFLQIDNKEIDNFFRKSSPLS